MNCIYSRLASTTLLLLVIASPPLAYAQQTIDPTSGAPGQLGLALGAQGVFIELTVTGSGFTVESLQVEIAAVLEQVVTLRARIYDTQSQESLGAAAVDVSLGDNQATATFDTPITLVEGQQFRVGFFAVDFEPGGGNLINYGGFDPDPPGLGGFPYQDAGGRVQVNGGFSSVADVFPTLVNPAIPRILMNVAPQAASANFVRADANADGVVDIADPVFTLSAMFIRGSPTPPCSKAADANDDGTLDVSDTVYTLLYIFLAGEPPKSPFPLCGSDPTVDALSCLKFAPCRTLNVELSQTVLGNGDDLQQSEVSLLRFFTDSFSKQTTADVVVDYFGATSVQDPVLLVVESIAGPGIRVANADGATQAEEPYFDLTGQVRGPSLDPGEPTEFRRIVFDNPDADDVIFTVRLERGEPLPPATAALEMEADEFDRVLLGLPAAGGETFSFPLKVRAIGAAPQSFDLAFVGSPGATGVISFDPEVELPTLSIATSGGPDNIATVDVRPISVSDYPGDISIALMPPGGGAVVARLPITVQSIEFGLDALTCQNDRCVETTVSVLPAMAGVALSFSAKREHRPGAVLPGPGPEEPSLRISELGAVVEPVGEALVTGADGTTRVRVCGGPGQGEVTSTVAAALSNAEDDFLCIATESCKTCCGEGDSVAVSANSVLPYSGEKKLSRTDLQITGRGIDYVLSRTYRSQASHLVGMGSGDTGEGWCFSYLDDRLVRDIKNILAVRSDFRVDVFTPTDVPGLFIAPREFYEQLIENGNGDYELRDASGTVKTFDGFDDLETPGRLLRIEDRNGNFLSFQYSMPAGLTKYVLSAVVDTMGRSIAYRYYPENDPNPGRRGRLWQVEDFRRDRSDNGRVISYDYDVEGNLVRGTGPAVTGTPNGDDFPLGKTFRYRYITVADLPGGLSARDQQRLLHNLTHVWYPNEVGNNPDVDPPDSLAREIVTYGTDPDDSVRFDRALTYRIGGTNATGVAAGGTVTYDYEQVAANSPTPNDPFLRVTETDRRGNVEVNTYSAWDTLLERREETRGLRSGEPSAFVQSYEYDEDKNQVLRVLPEGNTNEAVYDRANPNRLQQGNRTRSIRIPGPRGGDQARIASRTEYEPIYNRVARLIDPRGLDPTFTPPVADPGGRSQAERYTTTYFFDYQEGDSSTVLNLLAAELNIPVAEVEVRLNASGIGLGLGDLNGDGDITPRIGGNVVRIEKPRVALLPGSNQTAINGTLQPIVTLHTHNRFGQRTSTTDPEGNVEQYTYYAEIDPDGDGLRTAPLDGRVLDGDTGGYLQRHVADAAHLPDANNGNGADPTNIRTSYLYDDVGNVTRHTNGRGIGTGFFVNELDQVVETTRAASISGGMVDPPEPDPLTAFAYRTRFFYDFNNNIVRREVEDRGDTSNTGGFVDFTAVYDLLDNPVTTTTEVDLAETLVTHYRYDANENRTLMVQPVGNAIASQFDERDLLFQSTRGATSATAETLTPPAGPYDPRKGDPSTVTYNYDANRNRTEVVDAEDTDGSAANGSAIAGAGDVSTTFYDGYERTVRHVDAIGNESLVTYDPASNVIEQLVRGPVGGPSPTNSSGTGNVDLSRVRYLHDELNRVFQEDRVLFVSQGVATVRAPEVADSVLTPGDGNVSMRYEYDRDSRRTFRVEDDGDTFRTDYDGADRRILDLDPEGNTVHYAYDDNDNLIETLETDVSQVAGVADEVFLSTMFYDSLDRLSMRVENTVDFIGQTTRFRYDSRDNLVAVSDSKGQLSGAESSRRVFSGDLVDMNDPGNITLYSYDGIDRQIAVQQVLTQTDPFFGAEGSGDPGADEFGVKAPVGTHFPDVTQGGGDGLITTTYEWDGNSLLSSLTDDNGNRTQYDYDNLDRRVAEAKGTVVAPALADRDDPDTSIVRVFDRDDNVKLAVDENGSTIDCTFDALNRRTACAVSRAPAVIGTTLQTFEYDGLSRLRRATDDNDPDDTGDDSVATFAYDSLSRVVEETQQIGALPVKVISTGWRAENLRISCTYPNGRIVDASYDGLDRLDTKRDRGASEDLVDYDYIGQTRVLERRYPINGTRLTLLDDAGTDDVGYDALRRPVQLRHLRDDNSLVVGFTYSYDLMNNKLREEKLHDSDNSEVYQYDSRYRLVDFQRGTLDGFRTMIDTPSPDSLQRQTWVLDGVGNWNETGTTTGNVTTKEARQHSSFNELITRDSTSLTHDDNGNQTSDAAVVYEWDYANRLRRVTRVSDGDVVAQYAYDAVGRRIRTVATNGGVPNAPSLDGTTDFYYDDWCVCEERGSVDEVKRQYVYGSRIDESLVLDKNDDGDEIATDAGDTRLFYHQNTLFSVFALTDEAGAIAEGYQYEAYGRLTVYAPGPNDLVDFGGDDTTGAGGGSDLSNVYTFTGRRFDSESGLFYFRKRYHDPTKGRFLSRDPVGFDSALSLYQYVEDNPENLVDPMGLEGRRYSFRVYSRATWSDGGWYRDPNAGGRWVQRTGRGTHRETRNATHEVRWCCDKADQAREVRVFTETDTNDSSKTYTHLVEGKTIVSGNIGKSFVLHVSGKYQDLSGQKDSWQISPSLGVGLGPVEVGGELSYSPANKKFGDNNAWARYFAAYRIECDVSAPKGYRVTVADADKWKVESSTRYRRFQFDFVGTWDSEGVASQYYHNTDPDRPTTWTSFSRKTTKTGKKKIRKKR